MNKNIALLSIEYLYEKYVFRVLFILLAVAVAGYLYFVGATIFNIIARKEATRSAATLQTAIAGIEKDYFALTEVVNPTLAPTLGLAPIDAASYVYRPGSTAVADQARTATIERNAI